MKKPIYNDDVERIVNPHSAKMLRKAQNRKHDMLWSTVILLVCALLVSALMQLDVLRTLPGIVLLETVSCTAAFIGGRLWEVAKK